MISFLLYLQYIHKKSPPPPFRNEEEGKRVPLSRVVITPAACTRTILFKTLLHRSHARKLEPNQDHQFG